MKKLLCTFVCVIMMVSLSGCTSESEDLTSSDLNEISETSSISEVIPENNDASNSATVTPSEGNTAESSTTTSTIRYTITLEDTPTSNQTTPSPANQTSSAPVVSEHTHSYSPSIVRESTCETGGEIVYTCSCGDTYTEQTPPLGHTTDNGVCARCGKSIVNTEFIEQMAATAVNNIMAVTSTQIQINKITYMAGPVESCSDCSYVILVEYFEQNRLGASIKQSKEFFVINTTPVEGTVMNGYSTTVSEYMQLSNGPRLDVQTILSRL